MDHIISYIKTERIIHTQDIEFLRNLKKICLLSRNDIFKITEDHVKNLAWRNFDLMQRKNGYDLKFWVFMLMLSAVIALFLGYSRVSQEPIWFWESFLEDDLKDDLYLHLTIFLTVASF